MDRDILLDMVALAQELALLVCWLTRSLKFLRNQGLRLFGTNIDVPLRMMSNIFSDLFKLQG